MEKQKEEKKKKPEIYIEKIIFNDGTELHLNRGSIVVFTGANNTGKSQVLKDIENSIDKSNHNKLVVLKECIIDYVGEIDNEAFLKNHFVADNQGIYQLLESSFGIEKIGLINCWKDHSLFNGLHKAFVNRLSTEARLTSANALERRRQNEHHPISMLCRSETLAEKISDYFYQAFNVDLVVNRNKMTTIPLHIGKSPDKKKYTIYNQDEYYELLDLLPVLHEQGDGMRSFASVLLDTFTSDYSITLIDEPEAFLHPPQARIMGKMLADNNPNYRQLFISTHSEAFLQGLLDAKGDNVTVIRINRIDNINKMNILQNDKIGALWKNPILRYSNVLNGMFHEKVVVCESDYDCLFYQTVLNAVYEKNGKIAPSILFLHCGGKQRIKDVVKALRAVDVNVVAICDFDLINDSRTFKTLADAFGLEWENDLSDNMKVIYDIMNAKKSKEFDPWDYVKHVGKDGLTGEGPSAYEKIEELCKNVGLFIVPYGEMEGFDKTVNKEKKDWVYHVLERYDLATEPKMENARKFMIEITRCGKE